MAILVDLRNKVLKAINAGTFSKKFVAEIGDDPLFDLEELQDLHVTIVAGVRRSERAGRNLWEHDYDIDVGVQQRTDGTRADIDAKMDLPEEIADFFDDNELGLADADFLEAKIEPYYSLKHLDEMSVITSVVTLTFRLWR